MLCGVVVMDFALAIAAYPLLVEISDLDLFFVMDCVNAILAWFFAFDTFARAFAADVASDGVSLDLALAISATPEPFVSGSLFILAFGRTRSFLHHFRVKGSCH